MKAFFGFAAAMAMSAALLPYTGCTRQGPQEKTGASRGSHFRSAPDASKPSEAKMSVHKELFGKTPEGVAVDLYTLTNSKGLRVKIMTYGATIISVEAPDRKGKAENVTLSLDKLDEYLKGHPFFGSTVGRYANRIAKGKFTLDGKQYTLATNNNENHLHGGIKGFDKYVWDAKPVETADSVGVVFTHESPDGDEGYPGKLNAKVTYSLTNDNELKMEYEATTDKPTIVNLTNHTYWNLTGATDDVLGHELMLNADRYLPVDKGLIPLGELRTVKGTPMDFTKPMAIGSRIAKVEGGYDHCYVLNKKPGEEKTTVAGRDRLRAEKRPRHGDLHDASPACSSTRAISSTARSSAAARSSPSTTVSAWKRNIFPTRPTSRRSLRWC